MTANSQFRSTVLKVSHGEAPGNVGDLLFPDPEHFRAGELHEHVDSWKEIVTGILRFINLKSYLGLRAKCLSFPFFSISQGFLRENRMTLISLQERLF